MINSILKEKYYSIRHQTEAICTPLEIEDYVVQPSKEVSPPKWHLAHTTWFFENFLLVKYKRNYKLFNDLYPVLFNSYYKSQSEHWQQADRGLLSRPTVKNIYEYRKYVDEHISALLDEEILDDTFKELFDVGLNHEQQHQELLLMDIKYILGKGPVKSAYSNDFTDIQKSTSDFSFIKVSGGLLEFGVNSDDGFSYCNETPKHQSFLEDYFLSNRPITNSEYQEFIEDKGYENPLLWKSDGWSYINQSNDNKPLYWEKVDNVWFEYNLDGFKVLKKDNFVTHINFYEADAFARWKGCRLPSEYELENVYKLHSSNSNDFQSLNNTHWEWTSSSYLAYPKYKQPIGALGEYNGKFMLNQQVLRGGSFATPKGHLRNTYRNFFYPHQKWAFTGFRLAKDI